MLGARRGAVNLHGADVLQAPEDLPALTLTPRGWHRWASPCPTWSPQCRGSPLPPWGAPCLHLVQEGSAGPQCLAAWLGCRILFSRADSTEGAGSAGSGGMSTLSLA